MNGVGTATDGENMWMFYIITHLLTLDSDDGVGRDVSFERGSTGIESGLRC